MDRKKALLAALEAHVPDDPVERAFRDETLALVAGPGDPFDRARFAPGHVTASGFVLSPSHDRVLLLHHAKLGRWLQPGGHVEPGDADIEAASAREVREETGAEVRAAGGGAILDLDVHAIPARGDVPEHRHFDVRYLWIAGRESLAGSGESQELAWVPLEELAGRFDSPSLARVHSKLVRLAKTSLE